MKRTFIILAFLLLCQASQLLAQTSIVYEYATLMLSIKYNEPSTAILITAEGEKIYSCPIMAPSTKKEEMEMIKYSGYLHNYVHTQRLTFYMNLLALEGWDYYESIDAGMPNSVQLRYVFRRVKP